MCTHLNRNRVESNLSVLGIRGCHENALLKNFQTSPHLSLYASIFKIDPVGPASSSGNGLDSGCPSGDLVACLGECQVRAHFKALIEDVLVTPRLDPGWTQVTLKLDQISAQECGDCKCYVYF